MLVLLRCMCYFLLIMWWLCLVFQEFDSVYGNGWQCVVGSNFGCYFTHSSGTFIYFALETLNFLIFKGTSSWFILCTIWGRIQGLVIREASICSAGQVFNWSLLISDFSSMHHQNILDVTDGRTMYDGCWSVSITLSLRWNFPTTLDSPMWICVSIEL